MPARTSRKTVPQPHLLHAPQFFISGSTPLAGSGSMPSASNLLRASSRAQVWILQAVVSLICTNELTLTAHPLQQQQHHNQPNPTTLQLQTPRHTPSKREKNYSRRIRFIRIRHDRYTQATPKPPNPNLLPSLLLILLARGHAKQPAARRIIVRLVRVMPICIVTTARTRGKSSGRRGGEGPGCGWQG